MSHEPCSPHVPAHLAATGTVAVRRASLPIRAVLGLLTRHRTAAWFRAAQPHCCAGLQRDQQVADANEGGA